MAIPSITMPPTYQFNGVNQTNIVNIHYFIRFAVTVEGMFTNFNVDAPFILGTESDSNVKQQQMFNPLIISYSSNPDQIILKDDEQQSADQHH